jgi:hypothetical protein
MEMTQLQALALAPLVYSQAQCCYLTLGIDPKLEYIYKLGRLQATWIHT